MRKIEVIGHRGARSFAPENTLPGYKLALEYGTDYIDADIIVTKDETLIAYHDLALALNSDILIDIYGKRPNYPQLEGESNEFNPTGRIKDINFEYLNSHYCVELNPTSSYGKFFPNQFQLSHLKIPTLQEVVDCTNQITHSKINFQFEIKNDLNNPSLYYTYDKLATLMYEFIDRNDLFERVKVQAFDWRILVKLASWDNRIKTAFLEDNQGNSFRHFFNDPQMVELAQKSVGITANNSVFEVIKAFGGYSYEPEDVILTKEQIEAAHKLGIKVIVWRYPEHSGSTFDEALVNKLIDYGIDGFIIDDPLRMNRLLENRGYHTPKKYELNPSLRT